MRDGPGGDLGTAAGFQLGHHVAQVNFGGLLGDSERPADLTVRPAGSHERGHLALAAGKRRRLGSIWISRCGATGHAQPELLSLLGWHCPAGFPEPLGDLRSQRVNERLQAPAGQGGPARSMSSVGGAAGGRLWGRLRAEVGPRPS